MVVVTARWPSIAEIVLKDSAAVMQDSRRRPSQIPELDRSIALWREGRPA